MRRVRDVMTARVITARTDEPYKDLVARMLTFRVGALPIVDRSGTLLGIVTEADLIGKVAYPGARGHGGVGALIDAMLGQEPFWLEKARGMTAGEIMSHHPATIGPDETIRSAARAMIENDVKHLPVLSNAVVVGMVSRSDLLKPFDRPDDEIRAECAAVLERCGYGEGEMGLTVSGGVARLSGPAGTQREVETIEHLIASVDGVVSVTSELRARRPA